MTEPKKYPENLNLERSEALLAALPEEAQQKVKSTTFADMVLELAKPGEAIRSDLNFTKFVRLLNICAAVINRGNELDIVKKAVVYNKELPLPDQLRLPDSQALAQALESLTAEKAHLLHMAIGFAGEAAEMLEQIVRHVLGAELDVDNVVEEGGDGLFYIQGLLGPLDHSMNDSAFATMVKLLGKRYKNGYSDAAAQERDDKEPAQ